MRDCSVDFSEFLVACLYSDGEAASALSGENALEYFLRANEYIIPSIQRSLSLFGYPSSLSSALIVGRVKRS